MTDRQQDLAFTRRQFLTRSALIGAVAPACRRPARAAGQAKSTVNFGFSLYGMRSLTVAQALKSCAMIGYDSVELVATSGWSCDPQTLSAQARQDIRKQLADQGLAVPCLMENLRLLAADSKHRENLDRLKAAAELGHAVSPDRQPVIETVLGGRSNEWERTHIAMADRLHTWAKVGEASRTIIAIKAHIGGALHTPDDAKWLHDQIDSPWLKLNYDYSHFQLAGFSLDHSLSTMIADAVFIHVKDRRGKPGDFEFLLPGEGDIDYSKYFGLLKKYAYSGAVTVEVSGQIHGKPGYDPVASARKSYTNLAPLLKQAGLLGG